PIRLPLKVRSMAGRALLGIDDLTARNEARIIRVRFGRLDACAEPHQHSDQDQDANGAADDEPPRLRSHRVRSDRRYLISAAAARTRTTMRRSHSSPAPHIIIPPMPSIMRSIIDL